MDLDYCWVCLRPLSRWHSGYHVPWCQKDEVGGFTTEANTRPLTLLPEFEVWCGTAIRCVDHGAEDVPSPDAPTRVSLSQAA